MVFVEVLMFLKLFCHPVYIYNNQKNFLVIVFGTPILIFASAVSITTFGGYWNIGINNMFIYTIQVYCLHTN